MYCVCWQRDTINMCINFLCLHVCIYMDVQYVCMYVRIWYTGMVPIIVYVHVYSTMSGTHMYVCTVQYNICKGDLDTSPKCSSLHFGVLTWSVPFLYSQVLVRVLSSRVIFSRPMLYSYQMSLPHLPLPRLQDTLKRVSYNSVCVCVCGVCVCVCVCAVCVCVCVCVCVHMCGVCVCVCVFVCALCVCV